MAKNQWDILIELGATGWEAAKIGDPFFVPPDEGTHTKKLEKELREMRVRENRPAPYRANEKSWSSGYGKEARGGRFRDDEDDK